MAHFAKLDENNVVVEVHGVSNEALDPNNEEQSGIIFLIEWSDGYSNWKQTSCNTYANTHSKGKTPFRKNYAGIGYTWDGTGFAAPQPFPSWTLNADSYLWEPPVAMPTDGKLYQWDESTTSWIEVSE